MRRASSSERPRKPWRDQRSQHKKMKKKNEKKKKKDSCRLSALHGLLRGSGSSGFIRPQELSRSYPTHLLASCALRSDDSLVVVAGSPNLFSPSLGLSVLCECLLLGFPGAFHAFQLQLQVTFAHTQQAGGQGCSLLSPPENKCALLRPVRPETVAVQGALLCVPSRRLERSQRVLAAN